MGLVTVKAKAPKYYRPSVMTFKFGVLLDSKGDKLLEKIKEDYAGYVKSQLESQNQAITLRGLKYEDIKAIQILASDKWFPSTAIRCRRKMESDKI